MFRNYFKIVWRQAKANKSYTAISMISLVLGITIFGLILIWVNHELSYDKQFKDSDRIARVETSFTAPDGSISHLQTVGWPVSNVLKTAYPEIEDVTEMRDWQPDIKFNETHFFQDALFADNEFLKIFSYQLSEGNRTTALSEPFSVIISQEMKKKFFNNGQNVVGKILMINDSIPYKITGVFKDLSAPSHLKFDMIGSLSTVCAEDPQGCKADYESGWLDINMYNYVKLKKNVNPEVVSSKIRNLVAVNGGKEIEKTGIIPYLKLAPLKDIYLKSDMPTGSGNIGSIKTVYLFSLIGLFILIIACLNFINLTTAKSVERAKEIGVKKILGGNRKTLILQFLTETGALCLVATLLSTLLMISLLPLFNQITGETFSVGDFFSTGNILTVVLVLIVLIPFAGFNPAIVLSSYKPITVLKGKFAHSFSGALLRKGLVITQFVISIAFIIGTLIIWKQMHYMQNQDLGFDKDKILIADADKVPWTLRQNEANVFKNDLLAQAGIKDVTAATAVPGHTGWGTQLAWGEGNPKDAQSIVEYIPVDENYINTLSLKLDAGRNFTTGSPVDSSESLIINESAVKLFGWKNVENAIGKKLNTSGKEGVVIGVLKDYHQHGLQEKINPIVLGMASYVRMFAVKYGNISPKKATGILASAWKNVFPGYPLEYRFMDEDFQRQYIKEERFGTLFSIAAGLSILIACMGLLGLAIYSAQKRVKEIGVRKVLGANTGNIVYLIAKDFLGLVLIAFVIATPIAWWSMHKWIERFAYRTDINWEIFAMAGLAAVVIAIFTIGYQAVKTAVTNPVKSLRTE